MKEIYRIEEDLLQISNNTILTQYTYLKQKLKEIEQIEIEGYKRRVRYLGTYDKGEPDIAFYSKLEEKNISKEAIGQLAEDKDGTIYTDNKNIIKISTKYFTDLYTPNRVNVKTQNRLLRNIKNKLTPEQKQQLDAPINQEEIKKAVFQMQTGKSPGLDGIPIEFYQEYWDNIKEHYMRYINKVKIVAFSKNKNTSVIKLIYKKLQTNIFDKCRYKNIDKGAGKQT